MDAPKADNFRVRLKWALRRLFDAAAALSLLLFIASLALWARSYWHGETLHWFGDGRELSLASRHGQVDCYRVWTSMFNDKPTEFKFFQFAGNQAFESRVTVLKRSSGMSSVGPFMSFALFWEGRTISSERFIEVMMPWWFVTLLTILLPFIWLRRWQKRRRMVKPGFCKVCGYDLRATPRRCPECGDVPMAAWIET